MGLNLHYRQISAAITATYVEPAVIDEGIASLTEREQLVVKARFSDALPALKDVASGVERADGGGVGLTANRVRQIEGSALRKLRSFVRRRDDVERARWLSMRLASWAPLKDADLKVLAKGMAVHCVRNTVIEDYHTRGSLSEADMKAFNKEVVNHLYTWLSALYGDSRTQQTGLFTMLHLMPPAPDWDPPELAADMVALFTAAGRAAEGLQRRAERKARLLVKE